MTARKTGNFDGPMVTELRVDERGDETHESWLLIRAAHISGTPVRLFDSELTHHNWIQVTVSRCSRRRELKHDRLHPTEVLLEMSMSQAQWGAFVSSFGQGGGVPASLTYLTGVGRIPQAVPESRLEQSHKEVREAGEQAVEKMQAAYDEVMAVFEAGGGKRAMREALRGLETAISHVPANMAYAAKTLTEHAENVVTKARADIEGMTLTAMENGQITGPAIPFELGRGDTDDEEGERP